MKILRHLLLITVTFTLFGCFEIIEDVKINEDGSGTFRYLVNLSQSATKIKSIMLLDEFEGQQVPTQQKIQSDFTNLLDRSKKIKGISAVKGNVDFDQFIFTYQCNFESIENLNIAFDSVANQFGNEEQHKTKHFEYNPTKKTFTRNAEFQLEQEYNKLSESKKLIFEGANYICIYRFSTEIKTVLTNNTSISKNQMVSFCKLPLISIAKNGNVLNQQLQLK